MISPNLCTDFQHQNKFYHSNHSPNGKYCNCQKDEYNVHSTPKTSGLVKCELRVASCELRVASYELRVAPVLRVASCELVVKSASWYI